jgi:hypothetical protein
MENRDFTFFFLEVLDVLFSCFDLGSDCCVGSILVIVVNELDFSIFIEETRVLFLFVLSKTDIVTKINFAIDFGFNINNGVKDGTC